MAKAQSYVFKGPLLESNGNEEVRTARMLKEY